ncbi:MAG: hypothetical protein QOE90_2664 [Thermoplasmata archaeon]|jgi:hypothetical protein|nr:hypothetical protein [Thermoplasmata archaeon]
MRSSLTTSLACTVAFLAPWAILSALLPDPMRIGSLALLAALGGLLVCASVWAAAKASRLGLDPEGWAFACVVTAGYANAVLLFNPKPRPSLAYLCGECGREGRLHEPFCFGCGAVGA